MTPTETLLTNYGARLAYHRSPGRSPGVIFLTGFMSNMTGDKATRLEAHLKQRGNAYLRFDYRGHGQSSERFEQGCISDWCTDALAALDLLTEGPQVLVGSSMGSWIAFLTAMKRPDRIAALLGVASAADFTDSLPARHLNPQQQQQLQKNGRVQVSSDYDQPPYVITQRLLDDGRQNRLLHRPIALDIPVRLIHGMSDEDIPWQTSLKISEQLSGNDVETLLIKAGDHRLSSAQDLDRLCRVLDDLLDQLESAQRN